jgi:oligogalacturonide lyase
MNPEPTRPPEGRTFADPVSGAPVWQATDYRGHSHHLYFTSSGLYDDGRRLVIASHREGAANLGPIRVHR